MNHSLYIILGLIPSLIWLLFFLRKDAHPEPNRMILKIFFYGMVIALIAAFVEIGFFGTILGFEWLINYPILSFLLYHFIGIALVEEFLKYLVVREKVINDPEYDEPVDAMLYMIIAGLGFAALENILIFLPTGQLFSDRTIYLFILRFIGATFLHALCCATVGYFLALSFFETKKRFRLVALGLIIASLLHGIYNISIIKAEENLNYLIITIILLTGLAFFVSFAFKKLKKTASVCKIK